MNVEETLVAVFPDYNQNHGIERIIPFLNQNDTNLTMESASSLHISVTRNGEPEDYTGGARKFYGWATKSNANTTEVINFDTFTIEEDIILYAIYEGHTHTICGATESVCSHVDGTQHNGVQVDWEPFPVMEYRYDLENETNDYI